MKILIVLCWTDSTSILRGAISSWEHERSNWTHFSLATEPIFVVKIATIAIRSREEFIYDCWECYRTTSLESQIIVVAITKLRRVVKWDELW